MLRWLLRLLRGEGGFGRISVGAAMVIALGGGLGAYYVTQGGGGDPSFANIWIDTTANPNNCTRQATAGSYADADACSSMTAAYAAASCGDTVRVKAGSYDNQELSATSKSCAGSYIIFRPAEGESVTFRRISCPLSSPYTCQGEPSNWVEIRDFVLTTTLILSEGYTANWRVIGIDGGTPQLGGVNIYMNGNDWGPCESDAATEAGRCSETGSGEQAHIYTGASNIVIDGDTFHDFIITPASGAHFECMFNNGSTGDITIRNSHFYNCETYGIYFTSFVAGHQYNGSYTLENNWFGRTCCFGSNPRSSAINLGGASPGGPVKNLLIRFNSFAPGQTLVREGGLAGSNNRAIGNIFGTFSGGCISDVTYTYNAFVGGTCGTGDVNLGALYYVNGSDGAAGNYHLTGSIGSADNLVLLGTGDYALTTDRDSETRPQNTVLGTNCTGSGSTSCRDAGSDERTLP